MFENGAHPINPTGQDIDVNWTPARELRFGFNVTQNLGCRADATVFQILTTAGTPTVQDQQHMVNKVGTKISRKPAADDRDRSSEKGPNQAAHFDQRIPTDFSDQDR